MAHRRTRNQTPASGTQRYTKLEHRLVLLTWLNALFGYASNAEMLQDTKKVAEGYDSEGHSYLYRHLQARGSKVKIPEADLARYDENIRLHLETINRHRAEPITLRYFQHLAALYTEVFLDRLFNHKDQLLADLNAFVKERNAGKHSGGPKDEPFTEEDLNKLAYWMATGSGKTLLLHLNYYQFLHYHREQLDNVLLITPNEGLSEQHLRELELSGIPARRFKPKQNGPSRGSNKEQVEVQVLEITKLVEEKRGSGVSVPVEDFEGRNLIFVDEGHKGAGGKAWFAYREALGRTGFTFEYSATFGQALSAAGDDELTKEYGKAIIFDYSYRYFYGDGFGKDFRILNLQSSEYQEHTDTLLLGNLLTFYEQLRFYEENRKALSVYNLEKPLWVFVGSTVNAVYKEKGQKRSDVLTVVRFLHRVLSERDWAIRIISNLLQGESGLSSPEGTDVFHDHFKYLKELGLDAQTIYEGILQCVFHAPSAGGLHLFTIRNSQGEIGLKAAGAEHYFGVIYIGDASSFKQLVEEREPEIVLKEDVLSASLFSDINRPDSRIHILVGARKFMEGWNSWRVSTMGLLNIGRQEGSQIIQLFGRGVRLKGKGMSMKRSIVLNDSYPHIELLETLYIFALRADYMALFREYLEREGIETEPMIELTVPIVVDEPALKRNLVIPRAPEHGEFTAKERFVLEADENIRVRVDMSAKLQEFIGFRETRVQAGEERKIPLESLSLVDWERVYLDLLDYKANKGWHNLIIHPGTPRQLFGKIKYTLIADDTVVQPRTFAERELLQQAVTKILRSYLDAFYRHRRERWETGAMEYRLLDENDPNLAFNRDRVGGVKGAYIIRVKLSDKDLVNTIQRRINTIQQLSRYFQRLWEQENKELPRIFFGLHLYLPLLVEKSKRFKATPLFFLVEKSERFKATPPPLNESEAQFIYDLRDFWKKEKDASMRDKEVYVLRNLSRGKGVGFFEDVGFYPDFILWVLDTKTHHQRIVFVEPHGMMHAKPYIHDEKARLWERLPELAKKMGRNDVSLDAFIISATPFDELHKHYDDGTWTKESFAKKHILFQERSADYDYIKTIFLPSCTTS